MEYRTLGRTGVKVGAIGMGLEHLLVKDQETVTKTIQAAAAGGVTYLDCLSQSDFAANADTNEEYARLGVALEGIRDKFHLNFLGNVAHTVEDIARGFACFQREVKTDYVDSFMLACCDKSTDFDAMTGPDGVLAYALQLQAEKKIGFIGISTHSSDIAYRAIEHGAFDILMYPVNPAFDAVDNEAEFADNIGKLWDNAYEYDNAEKSSTASRRNVYAACARHNIGLVAMKPFAAAWLFRPDLDTGFTPVNLIAYALAQNGLSVAAPGCASPEEITEVLSYYTCAEADKDYSAAVAASRWSIAGNCLYCNHCLPCTVGINVAQIHRLADSAAVAEPQDLPALRLAYEDVAVKASACIGCGVCTGRCPFHVDIIGKMTYAASVLE